MSTCRVAGRDRKLRSPTPFAGRCPPGRRCRSRRCSLANVAQGLQGLSARTLSGFPVQAAVLIGITLFQRCRSGSITPSSSESAPHPASLTLWPVTSAQASSWGCKLSRHTFKASSVETLLAGYHVDMVSTNAAFLLWLAGLVYALVTPWTVAEHADKAWILMLSAFCNFFAVATTRFNDSGFTSGLAFWLPPFFFCNFLLLLVGALPTMLLEGCLCGYFVASSQTAPVTMGVCCLLALAAVFFYDVWAWMPKLGHLGGAGSSEPRPASAPPPVLLSFQRFRQSSRQSR